MTLNNTPTLAEVLSYARRLIEEAEAYQVSNADCDWDDVEDCEFTMDIDQDQWNDATIRERLWDIGAGDTGLDSLLTAVNIAYGNGDIEALRDACWILWDFLTLEYGHEADTPDDLSAPPFAR